MVLNGLLRHCFYQFAGDIVGMKQLSLDVGMQPVTEMSRDIGLVDTGIMIAVEIFYAVCIAHCLDLCYHSIRKCW